VKLRTRKLAVFATCLGIGAAFPVLSSADKGGVPHNTKPCPAKGKGNGKSISSLPSKAQGKGKKCGFKKGGTTSTAAPSVTSGTTTEQETTSSTTSSTTSTTP
jgi:hypothetical protein